MRKISVLFVFSIASILILSSMPLESVYASVVVESEAVGVDANSSPGTAEAIPSTAFTQPEPPTVFPRPNSFTATITGFGGGNDVDFYAFSTIGSGPNVLLADMDRPVAAQFDEMIAIFDSSGTLIAFDDDSAPDAGDLNGIFIPFVGSFTIPPGNYFVAVSQFANFPTVFNCPNNQNLIKPDGNSGGQATMGCAFGVSSYDANSVGGSVPYTLHLSLQEEDVIGGEILPIHSPTLLLAGLQSSAIWMLPILAGVTGLGAFYIKTRMSKE